MKLNLGASKQTSSSTGSFDRTDQPIVPDWISGRTQQLDAVLGNLAGADPNSFVAGADPLQTEAARIAGGLNPRSWNYDAAIDMTRQVGTQNAPTVAAASVLENLPAYMSPYTKDVVDSALADYDFGAGQTRAEQALAMAGAGAFGGSGSAITRAQTEDALTRGRAATSANLRDQAFRVGAGLSESDAGRRQSASVANAQLEAQNRAQQLAAAQQMAALSGQLGAEERAILGTQAGVGEMMRSIAGEQASAPLDVLAMLAGIQSGLPLELFVGNRSTGTESSKSKGTRLYAGGEYTYGGKT